MNDYDFSISYSAYKLYRSCPLAYKHRYILKSKSDHDPRDTMFGSIIGKLFEWFYQEKLYLRAHPVNALLELIPQAKDEVFINEGYVRGSDSSYESSLSDLLQRFVPTGVEIIRTHRLLTPTTAAELDLSVVHQFKDYSVRLVGRADFVHYFESGCVIVDGKASKHRDRYVDSTQLVWYALSHYLKYHVPVNQTAFLYWCFPDNPISYVKYDANDMRNLLSDIKSVSDRVRANEFESSVGDNCRRCAYRNQCNFGQEYLSAKRSENIVRINDSVFDVESI